MGFIDRNTVGAYIVSAEILNITYHNFADSNQFWKFDDKSIIV